MKAVTCLAIMGILVGSYLGGKMTNTGVVEYEYAEVYNAVGACDEGTFMGGCSDCKECTKFQYNGGGCSYFKDTLCVLCEPIAHCGQVEDESGKLIPAITCTDAFDHICHKCENGYWDLDCKPCAVCEAGTYETVQCSQAANTECAPCTECRDGEYLSKACTYTSDSECSECSVCEQGKYADVACQFMETVYTVTDDTVCEPCTEPADGQFVTDPCTVTADTKFEDCGSCTHMKQYISEACYAGTTMKEGADIKCTDCVQRRKSQYTVWHCDATDVHDSLHKKCSECVDNEYMHQACTATSDTLCPDCTKIDNCKSTMERCTDGTDQTCKECEEGFFGEDCCFEKQFSACGSMTTRERRADAYGYEGNTNEEFIQFCLELCEEFPDCMAFEVEDGGEDFKDSGSNTLGGKGALCYFKSAFTQLTEQYEYDCYSNVCRQGDSFMDFTKYEIKELIDQAHALITSHANGVRSNWGVAPAGSAMAGQDNGQWTAQFATPNKLKKMLSDFEAHE